MSILHAKCPVCAGRVYHFGGRRRRCCQCGHTWSIRPKRRGRKVGRSGQALPRLILLENHTARQLVHRYRGSPSALRYHVRKHITILVKQPNLQPVPAGDLALLVDGLWSTFQNQYWVLYDMAVKPITQNVAYFLDPIQRPGRENAAGWNAAIDTIPYDIKTRIRALVSDDLRGFEAIARRHGWVNQFCHWHLLVGLRNKLGRRRRQLGSRWLRERIYTAICEALVTPDECHLELLVQRLKQLAGRWDCTYRLRYAVNEFLRLKASFRAYQLYPELQLPTTTCAMESMHSALRRAIGSVNVPQSAFLRAKAFLRLRRTITCHGSVLQQN